MSVTASIGPISGINYGALLTGLTQLDQAPIDSANAQIATIGKETDAFNSLATDLTGLKIAGAAFSTSAIFHAATASSSNPNAISATAGIGTPVGSYSFTVQRVASSSQIVSQGFADANTTQLNQAGNLTFEFGKGTLNPVAKLSDLNGGNGVSRGSIRIIDRSGAATSVDLSGAVDINDVVTAINNASGVNVTASLKNDQLVLTDHSGGAGNFSISNVGSTTTASDLGIATSVASSTVTGTDINKLGTNTNLNSLNDGNGVRTAGVVNDFAINSSTGALNVSLNGAKTIGDVIAKINAAGKVNGTQVVTATVSTDGHGITLTDSGGGAPTVTALNGSQAAQDLGLTGTGSGGVLTGTRINGGLNSALLSDLRGGSGIGLGPIVITDSTGVAHAPIDLTGAKTVNDVLSAINGANAGVTASLNSAGTGIQLTDTAGGAGSISVANGASGTAAADLGLTNAATGTTLNGGDLHLRYISYNTALSTLNGGAGFKAGQIKLTDATGASSTVDLSSAATIGDVIAKINQNSTGIKASIDKNGNGILLTDSSGGTGTANVQEVNGGSTAASLNLLGSFTSKQLDGSFEKTVAILATDKLQDVVNKINEAGIGVAASIINDGSGANPYRLNLTSRNSGAAGNIIFDGSAAGIQATTLTKGQDAVVQYGTSGGTNTLQVTSSSNTLTGLVPNLTVNLLSASSQPVTVSVTNDNSKISDSVQSFVDAYNKVIGDIATDTKFDANNPANNGVLFANSTVEQIQQGLGLFAGQVFNAGGTINNLGQVGITLNQDGTMAYDSSVLQTALANSPNDVRSFFTASTNGQSGVGKAVSDLLTRFTDSQNGLVFEATDALNSKTKQLNDRVTYLNQLLTSRKQFYSQQFANLETTISQLQSQGTAMSNYTASKTTSSTTSG
jgi:flagellar hook-associated protein 2